MYSTTLLDVLWECETAAHRIDIAARGFRAENMLDVALLCDDWAEALHGVVNRYFTEGDDGHNTDIDLTDYQSQVWENQTNHPTHEAAYSRSLQVAGVQDGRDDLPTLLAPYGWKDNLTMYGTRPFMANPEHGEGQV